MTPEQQARALWQLLDDIDTRSDQIRADSYDGLRAFYQTAMLVVEKRHDILDLCARGEKVTCSHDEALGREEKTRPLLPKPDPLYPKQDHVATERNVYGTLLRGERDFARRCAAVAGEAAELAGRLEEQLRSVVCAGHEGSDEPKCLGCALRKAVDKYEKL